ncbi:hypothetical protein JL107_13420 [Nakamurella flavida]|uniref:GP-PDE domain-containing protein n=1 Tax=Nakamurella flavida TaxID=363630 RepID=A0A938YQL9_9ACTN|nr:glycerophosphodiester phosphodiesterase family protein [Nakamurella flavida]MBM9477443.1 hypothetical protein [Nakamurella flavida]MDP9777376.1 glycerophosphoryl diester phosphodiesterase [Nakamurella flavida]
MNPLRRNGPTPLVIAHRGASSVAPENTLPAFEAGWAAGAAWVECDVQPTMDGVPVLLHDDELDRTTTGTGPVRERSAREIAALDAGAWFGAAFAGTPVPRFADLLTRLDATRRVLLEIKGEHSRGQVRTLLREIRTAGHDHRVVLQSFERAALGHARDLDPHRPLGLLVEDVDGDPVEVCRRLGVQAYNPPAAQLTGRPGLVDALHAADVAVAAWTSDDPREWAALTGCGVDAIITNRPAELVAWQAAAPR